MRGGSPRLSRVPPVTIDACISVWVIANVCELEGVVMDDTSVVCTAVDMSPSVTPGPGN